MVVLTAILWILGLGLLGLLALTIRQVTYWRIKGIPYLDATPLIGLSSSIFMRKKSLAQLLQDVYNSCPGARYFGSLDFNTPIIIIKDPEIVKEIGVKSFDYFPNHRSFIDDDFDPLLSRNIFSLRDERWREMRGILSPTFTASKMKYMFQLVSKCSMNFVRYLKEHPEVTNEMDLKDAYTRYTNDVIATTAFGISVDSMKDPKNDFYVFGNDVAGFTGWSKMVKFIAARIAPKFMRFIGLSFFSSKTDTFFKSLVYETIKTREENNITRPDMIHLLMQARDNDNGLKMTNDDIVAQAFIFFLAGFDTSSRLMCFTSHMIAHHPEIQERIREEIDTILTDDQDDVTYEKLTKMKYMDMVLSETLRLFPPMPSTDRVCTKSYQLPPPIEGSQSFIVEPNTSVVVPIYGYHHDPNYFPEPEKFDPERFNDERKNDIKPYTYMPFGFGPRKCIGDRFALMETKILIVHLLQNFLFKPSTKTSKDIKFTKDAFVMGPENGFWMRLEPRQTK